MPAELALRSVSARPLQCLLSEGDNMHAQQIVTPVTNGQSRTTNEEKGDKKEDSPSIEWRRRRYLEARRACCLTKLTAHQRRLRRLKREYDEELAREQLYAIARLDFDAEADRRDEAEELSWVYIMAKHGCCARGA